MPRAVSRSLYWSVLDGVLHAVMVGLSESYLGAFAVQLGHRDAALALLVTLPMLCGALSQLAASPLARLLGSRKRLVVVGALMQAASHVAFIGIALRADGRLWPLLAAKIVFWVAGSAIAPAWNTMMGALTAEVPRERYFAWRSALVNVALLVAFTGAGFLLDDARRADELLPAFAVLQGVALAARLVSGICLALHEDPAGTVFPGGRAVRRLFLALRDSRLRVPVYYAALMFGTYVAAPFFTPYMLRVLELDFVEFSTLTATSILAKVLAFPFCHRLAARLGLSRLLVWSGVGVAASPILWWPADDFVSLLPIQVLSGAAWAGLEFANFQLLLHASDEEHRIELMSLASSLAGFSQIAGAVGGAMLLENHGASYVDLFVLSGLLRLLPLALFSPLVLRYTLPPFRLAMRLLSVRPGEGVVQRPIVEASTEERVLAERKRAGSG